MQIGRTHLTQEERQPRTQLQAKLTWSGWSFKSFALVDSGAEESFIDSALVLQMGIPTEPLDIPLEANALNGHLLARVEHQTPPLTLLLSGNHSETLRLHIISSPQAPIFLGHPWLQLHNPHIDWSTGTVVSWSKIKIVFCSV